jgi:RND family efflux transporter MFP subunit
VGSKATADGPGVARLRVSVVRARSAAAERAVTLPGSLEAFIDTAIHARTSGYLGAWLVDIGDRVKAGQTLASIESPEIDQELNQARANLGQARANLILAKVTAQRWQGLAAQNAVAQQEVDQKTADYAARQADVVAAEANVQRLAQMQRFETVTAPFDGVITARHTDIGDLISAGSGPELFHLAQTEVLRAYVNVPQSDATAIRVGAPADVLLAEFPGRAFSGVVARYAGALDAGSRTLLVEVRVPNAQGELFAGMFCQIRFRLRSSHPTILIPSNDAIIRADGTLVARVTGEDVIHLQKVILGRDFGTTIEVLDGLAEGDRLVDNPSDALVDGEAVEPVEASATGR